MSYNTLKIRQIDATLALWRKAALPPRPGKGWIHAIRTALSMSSAALGARLGMTGAGVLSLEASEAADSITLGTLRKVATALDCELQYALVPKHGIAETLQKRAKEVARERVLRVSHTMALEEQSVDSELTRTQIEELAETLLRKRTKELWR